MEEVQYICIQSKTYKVQLASKDVTALTLADIYVLEHGSNQLGKLEAGDAKEAETIKEILFNPPKPPPIVTITAPSITNPTTREERHLNFIARRTPPIQAYQIGSPFETFLSPVATNIQVNQPGKIIPTSYYAPMNNYPDVRHGQSIATGITPRGNQPQTEALWMLTQQLKTKRIIDLSSPLEGAAAAFTPPYYPSITGQEVQYGCMRVRNIKTEKGETVFEVENTITQNQSTVRLVNSLWNRHGLVTPEELYRIGTTVSDSDRSIILSESGHSKTGLAIVAEKLVDLAEEGCLFEDDCYLDHLIISTRKAIGPDVINTPEELK